MGKPTDPPDPGLFGLTTRAPFARPMAPFISEIPITLTTIETRNLPLLSALQNPPRVRALVEKPIIARHPNYNLVHLRVYFGKLVST